MKVTRLAALVVVTFVACAAAQAVTIPTVPVGNPGNPGDTEVMTCCGSSIGTSGYGSVASNYRIGTTEVTNAQYVEFLNGVDPTGGNTLALYNGNMTSQTWGGINFSSGAADGSKYSVKAPALSGSYPYADKPVVYVSWYDSIRFANWLHNGQGSGDTETGAYTLGPLGAGGIPTGGNSITRNAGARWWLPSEDEWYKAAYYDPSGVYYNYPTGTDSVPNNNLPASDTGNSANFWNNGYTTGDPNYPLTDAGAYTQSASPYGTFDQGGNVWEWNESLIGGSSRGVRGGSWNFLDSSGLHASVRNGYGPSDEYNNLGFRVASIPEPASLTLCLAGVMILALRRARK